MKRLSLLGKLLLCMAVIFVLFFWVKGQYEGKRADLKTSLETPLVVEDLSDRIRETPLITGQHERNLVLPAVVEVHGSNASGSGSIFEVTANHVLIVTAGHVVAENENLSVTFFHGKELPCEVVKTDSRADAALLAVKASDLTDEDRKILCRVRTGTEPYGQLKKNDIIFLVKGNQEEVQILEAGVVEKDKMLPEFIVPMLYADGTAQKGMSGSPVFDEEGYCIGILVAATEYGELAILPIAEILPITEFD